MKVFILNIQNEALSSVLKFDTLVSKTKASYYLIAYFVVNVEAFYSDNQAHIMQFSEDLQQRIRVKTLRQRLFSIVGK